MTRDGRGPAYRVETDRIVARCWSPSDVRPLRAAIDASAEHLRPWIPWMKDEPRSLGETVEWLRGRRARFDLDEDYRYAVFDPDERTLIGGTGLYRRVGEGAREIGYWIDVASAGKGYATEAAAAMVRVGFEVDGVDRIEIHCAVANEASARVPAKLGFAHDGDLRRRSAEAGGGVHAMSIWSMFADEYPGSPASGLAVAAFDCVGERLL